MIERIKRFFKRRKNIDDNDHIHHANINYVNWDDTDHMDWDKVNICVPESMKKPIQDIYKIEVSDIIKRKKTQVRFDLISSDGKKHYKSITIPWAPITVWKMLAHGALALKGFDIEKVRRERLRKGGK